MMKMSKNAHGSTIQKDKLIFTAKDVFSLLANLDELSGHNIRLREAYDGTLQIQIDQNIYTIFDENEIELF